MNRYFYIIALRSNPNAITDTESNYRLASGQVRADTMDAAFDTTCMKESVTREVDQQWTMRTVFDYYRNGKKVAVYITPMADDRGTDQ